MIVAAMAGSFASSTVFSFASIWCCLGVSVGTGKVVTKEMYFKKQLINKAGPVHTSI